MEEKIKFKVEEEFYKRLYLLFCNSICKDKGIFISAYGRGNLKEYS